MSSNVSSRYYFFEGPDAQEHNIMGIRQKLVSKRFAGQKEVGIQMMYQTKSIGNNKINGVFGNCRAMREKRML